jgi:uncharacterized membrane protein YphA (DoxX/SURF4 family)
MFIVGGLDALRNPESKVKAADAVVGPLQRRFPALPDDPAALVRVNGAVQVVAGSLLATGKLPRLAALALIGSIVPTTYAGHRFWEEADDATRAQQRIHFLKNMGLLGGLILAVADQGPGPSLGRRAGRQARRLGTSVAATSTVGAAATRRRTRQASAEATSTGRRAARQARRAAHRGADRAGAAVTAARRNATPYVAAGADRAGAAVTAARRNAAPLVSAGADRAGDLLSKAAAALPR